MLGNAIQCLIKPYAGKGGNGESLLYPSLSKRFIEVSEAAGRTNIGFGQDGDVGTLGKVCVRVSREFLANTLPISQRVLA